MQKLLQTVLCPRQKYLFLFPAPMHQEFCTAQPFAVATKTRATVLKPTLPLSFFKKFVSAKNYCGGLVGEGDKESDGEREREMKERGAAEQEAG